MGRRWGVGGAGNVGIAMIHEGDAVVVGGMIGNGGVDLTTS